jgi:hypothetical protein
VILLINLAFLYIPNKNYDPATNTQGSNWLANFFLIEPFNIDAQSYYKYRFWLFLGIILNSVTTLVFEKWFIKWLTEFFDNKGKVEKHKKFAELMD